MKLNIKKFFRFNVFDLLSTGCLIFLVCFLWFVEKPKMDLVNDCNDVYRKQMEKYNNFEIMFDDSEISLFNISKCPPCDCYSDSPTPN